MHDTSFYPYIAGGIEMPDISGAVPRARRTLTGRTSSYLCMP
jgi:hypothetical protein